MSAARGDDLVRLAARRHPGRSALVDPSASGVTWTDLDRFGIPIMEA